MQDAVVPRVPDSKSVSNAPNTCYPVIKSGGLLCDSANKLRCIAMRKGASPLRISYNERWLSRYQCVSHILILGNGRRSNKLKAEDKNRIYEDGRDTTTHSACLCVPVRATGTSVSRSNESRVVVAEMAQGAGGGGVTFRTRPQKQGVYPVYTPPRWQVTDLSVLSLALSTGATHWEQIDAVAYC
jgi:hypothetical protein